MKNFYFIAGPCAVENYDHIKNEVEFLVSKGIELIRFNSTKFRTSPYDFQGVGEEGFEYLKELKKEYQFKAVCEIFDATIYEKYKDIIDVVQVGSRNMYNLNLLKNLKAGDKPLILKRSFAATYKEWLNAAEYLILGGNTNIILCERGIRTFEATFRNTLDIQAIPYIKQNTDFHIIVDPSHATGDKDYIMPMAKAAIAAGADGILVEVHNEPKKALSDGAQSLSHDEFDTFYKEIMNFRKSI